MPLGTTASKIARWLCRLRSTRSSRARETPQLAVLDGALSLELDADANVRGDGGLQVLGRVGTGTSYCRLGGSDQATHRVVHETLGRSPLDVTALWQEGVYGGARWMPLFPRPAPST